MPSMGMSFVRGSDPMPRELPLQSGMGYIDAFAATENRSIGSVFLIRPLLLPRPTLVRGLTIKVNTALAGSEFVCVAYGMDEGGAPSDLIESSVVLGDTTGYKEGLFSSPVTFPRNVFVGGYWTGASATISVYGHTSHANLTWQTNYTSLTTKQSGYSVTNPLSTTPPSTVTIASTGRYCPVVWLVSA